MRTMRWQRGFNAVELILSLGVVSMLTATALSHYGVYIDQNQKDETRVRLRQLHLAMQEAYRRELLTISPPAGAAVVVGATNIADGASTTAALVGSLTPYASISAELLARDGFNQAVRVHVSNELTQVLAGTPLRYRIIALLSSGKNARFETTFDVTTGSLNPAGDDVYEVVNGYSVVREAYDDTAMRLERLASGYQNYFLTRFLANSTRNISTNYFAATDPSGSPSANWDQTGTVLTSGGTSVSAQAANMIPALGLALADVTTIFGQAILIDNSSSNVNHPDNPVAARTLPPYTARLIAPLPGGEQLVRTVAGVYN